MHTGSEVGEIRHDPAANRDETGFTGHVRDAASGLVYAQARFYHPALGRFLSPDPVGFASGGPVHFQRYGYVGNDPVNFFDPTGLDDQPAQSTCGHGPSNCQTLGGEYRPEEQTVENSRANRPSSAPQANRPPQTTGSSLPSANPRRRFDLRTEIALWAARRIGESAFSTELTVYRVYGGPAVAFGRSWGPQDPTQMADWRDELAVYPEWNSGEFYMVGHVTVYDLLTGRVQPTDNPGSIAGPQPFGAGPYDYSGTAIEWIIRDAENVVRNPRSYQMPKAFFRKMTKLSIMNLSFQEVIQVNRNNLIKYYSIDGGDGSPDFFESVKNIVLEETITASGLDEPIPIFRILGGGPYSGRLIIAQPRGPNLLYHLDKFGSVNAVLYFYSSSGSFEYTFPNPSHSIGYGVIATVSEPT